MRRSIRFAALLLAISPTALAAQSAAPPPASSPPAPALSPAFERAMAPMIPRTAASARIVTTHHVAQIGGRRVAYRAIVTEQPMPGPDGQPVAVAVTYAYVAEDQPDAAKRPILFLFNGGPGASSSPLHLQAFGPRRLAARGAATPMVDNAYSLLDVADMVFVDPVGTGASMPIAGRDASSYWGVGGDARGVASTIATWMRDNGRTGAPYVLVGESYGTARALAILKEDGKAKAPMPAGVVLLSLAIGGADGPVIADAVTVPTFAAVAWYHRAIDRRGRSVEDHYADALAFAQTGYVPALMQGPALASEERHRVAARMAALIGIPAATIEAHDLRIDKTDFMLGVLSAQGLRTGQLDGRVTRAIAASNFRPPFDDPSMAMGTGTTAPIEAYLRDELGYVPPSPYRTLNLGINFAWSWDKDYGGSYLGLAPAPDLKAAMDADPSLRVFAAGGYYDITTPVYAGQFALEQAGVPSDRLSLHRYPFGHSIFEDEAGLARLSTDVHAFISSLHSSPVEAVRGLLSAPTFGHQFMSATAPLKGR